DESIAAADRPYRRLPQLAANGYWPVGPLGLDYRLDTEVTWFDRSTGVTGLRSHLLPGITLPLRFAGIDLSASAALDHTRYQLNDVEAGDPEHPYRTVPIYSVDLGTVLERLWGKGDRWVQTLEPR